MRRLIVHLFVVIFVVGLSGASFGVSGDDASSPFLNQRMLLLARPDGMAIDLDYRRYRSEELRYFPEEYEAHIKDRCCPGGVCKALITFRIEHEICNGCGVCVDFCPFECRVVVGRQHGQDRFGILRGDALGGQPDGHPRVPPRRAKPDLRSADRTGDGRARRSSTRSDPERVLEELMAIRDPLYREIADLIVDTDGRRVQTVAREIHESL